MKTSLFITVLLFSISGLAAQTCKIKIYEDKGWFPVELKQALEAKNYEVSYDAHENEVDFLINYVPYSTSIGVGSRLKRYVYFELKESFEHEPLIFKQVGSSKKEFEFLMAKLNKRVLKQINSKLSVCGL